MLFNPGRGARERRSKLLVAVVVSLYIATLVSIAYVVIHFVTKFW